MLKRLSRMLLARMIAWAIVALALTLLTLENAAAQLALTGMGGGPHKPTPVPLAPFVSALLPIIAPLAVAAAGGAVTWLCATVARWVGAKHAAAIDDGHRAELAAAAEREAGVLVAAAADNLAGHSIEVGSPAVAAAAQRIGAELPGAMAKLGITPERVERLVAAAIGRLQAKA